MRTVNHHVPASVRDRRDQHGLAEAVERNVADVSLIDVTVRLQPDVDLVG